MARLPDHRRRRRRCGRPPTRGRLRRRRRRRRCRRRRRVVDTGDDHDHDDDVRDVVGSSTTTTTSLSSTLSTSTTLWWSSSAPSSLFPPQASGASKRSVRPVFRHLRPPEAGSGLRNRQETIQDESPALGKGLSSPGARAAKEAMRRMSGSTQDLKASRNKISRALGPTTRRACPLPSHRLPTAVDRARRCRQKHVLLQALGSGTGLREAQTHKKRPSRSFHDAVVVVERQGALRGDPCFPGKTSRPGRGCRETPRGPRKLPQTNKVFLTASEDLQEPSNPDIRCFEQIVAAGFLYYSASRGRFWAPGPSRNDLG